MNNVSLFPKLITKPARVRIKLADPKIRAKLSSPIVIKSLNPRLYHRLNETYNRVKPLKLVSAAWHKSSKNGDWFSILPHKPNKAVPSKISQFESLLTDESLLSVLRKAGFKHPTEIQKMAFSPIFNHDTHCALFASTGSGKTLAYLLPILQFMRTNLTFTQVEAKPRFPYCIILVPTNELSNQVHNLCLQFKDVCSSAHLHTALTPLEERNLKEEVNHIFVGTPSGINYGIKKGYLKLAQCRYLIIDEADSLLDKSFYPTTSPLLSKLCIADAKQSLFCQLVFCGATLPKTLEDVFESLTGSDSKQLQVVQGSSVECVLGHVKHEFRRIAPSKVQLAVRDLLSELVRKQGSVLVFCNSQTSVRKLSFFLTNEGFKHEAVYGDVDTHYRKNIMSLLRDGFVKVLIATDVISRGFDTSNVSHVINYDCPSHLSDYVHRAGRVGRVGQHGGSGRVVTFVCRPFQAEVVQEIEKSVRLHRPLMGVDSNIKQQFVDYAEVKRAKSFEEQLKAEDESLQ